MVEPRADGFWLLISGLFGFLATFGEGGERIGLFGKWSTFPPRDGIPPGFDCLATFTKSGQEP